MRGKVVSVLLAIAASGCAAEYHPHGFELDRVAADVLAWYSAEAGVPLLALPRRIAITSEDSFLLPTSASSTASGLTGQGTPGNVRADDLVSRGDYWCEWGVLRINENQAFDRRKVLGTLAHELWHHVQCNSTIADGLSDVERESQAYEWERRWLSEGGYPAS